MSFSIKIDINTRLILDIDCSNFGSPDGDRQNAINIYRYYAKDLEKQVTTEGEVLYERSKGIERLAALILEDLAVKTNSRFRQRSLR